MSLYSDEDPVSYSKEELLTHLQSLQAVAGSQCPAQKMLHVLQRIGKVGVWEYNPATDYFEASEELYHILGAYPKQLPNKEALLGCLTPLTKHNLGEQGVAFFAPVYHLPLELTCVSFKNRTCQLLCIGNFFDEKSGKIMGFLQDISYRKNLAKKLKYHKERLKTLQNIARMGSFEFHLQEKRLLWSDYMYEMLGVNPSKELHHASLMGFIHPDDKLRVLRNLSQKSVLGREYREDFRMIRADGHIIYVMATVHTQADAQGRPFKSVGVIQDISDRKEAEQKVQQQNDELRSLNKQLDQFVYSVSHDLRAPLTSARGLAEILKTETSEEERQMYLQLMEQSLERLDGFIQDIVQLSRNSRLDIAKEPIDFHELLAEVVAAHKFSEETEGVEIRLHVEQPVSFFSDRMRLLAVISNLFSNAIRYANHYQPQPYVQVTVHTSLAGVTCIIADNGQGIEENHLAHIFEMFYRANKHKSGSGLGLYIVKETVEKLQGRIEVASTYGEGSTFTVSLPSLG